MTSTRSLLLASLGVALGVRLPAASEMPSYVHVLAHGQAGVWRIETASGDRQHLELSDYPEVMTVTHAVVTSWGELLFGAVNATQQWAIFAYNPGTGERAGVSGPIDGYGAVVRGSGPGFVPGISGLTLAPWGGLYALRAFQGPVHVSLATGDRTVVSQSAEPPVGPSPPLARPVDVAVESASSLLVMDEYEGLVRIRLEDGARVMAYPSTLFIEPPVRFDRLRDGRIVHLVPGTDALFVFDPRGPADAPLSGRGRGGGPAFGALGDVAVAPGGPVLVFDVADPAVYAVDPSTGDRTLVSGAARGRGPALPTALDRPTLAVFTAESVPPDASSRPVRRRLKRLAD